MERPALPRPGSILYRRLLAEEGVREGERRRARLLNRLFIVPLYRAGLLPLLGLGRLYMLLEHRGRRTGRRLTTPLLYFRRGGDIYILSSFGEDADWLRNVRAAPSGIYIRIGLRRYEASAELVEDEGEREEFWRWLLVSKRLIASRMLGWRGEEDPDLSTLVRLVPILRIKPSRAR